MGQTTEQPEGGAEPGPVVRDRRLIDPLTGAVRAPAAAGPARPGEASAGGGLSDEALLERDLSALQTDLARDVAALEAELAERTADVQRVHAEYANYRKRVDRDRELVRETAVAAVLGELLGVLDDVDRAREHGELQGGFKSVAESLEAVVAKLGLERYGAAGDPFDPEVHEALTHGYSDQVDGATCTQVFQPGYRFAGRVVRPARVAVAEPGQPD